MKMYELDMYGNLTELPAKPGRLDRLPWYAKLALVVLALVSPWFMLKFIVAVLV